MTAFEFAHLLPNNLNIPKHKGILGAYELQVLAGHTLRRSAYGRQHGECLAILERVHSVDKVRLLPDPIPQVLG